MYVCICHGVTEHEIRAEISTGARTEEEIGDRSGAGTGCGMCVDKICALLRTHPAGHGRIAAEAAV
jgi:bacterioferritin-associated ferredoxin